MHSLITPHLEPPDNTLAHAHALLEAFGLKIDIDYGLVPISHKRGLYVVRIQGDPTDAESAVLTGEVVGVHGDVEIVPVNRRMQAAREIRAGYSVGNQSRETLDSWSAQPSPQSGKAESRAFCLDVVLRAPPSTHATFAVCCTRCFVGRPLTEWIGTQVLDLPPWHIRVPRCAKPGLRRWRG